jgi:sugar/nucleoside kinase (ribokinase family)
MADRPDYLVIGHVTKDLLDVDGGPAARPGGTATYSALAAQRFGLQAAVVTACSPGDEWLLAELRDAGVWVHAAESEQTTIFHNVYDSHGRRTQVLSAQAGVLEWGDVPYAWRGAAIVHLGPVAQEVPADMAAMFPYCLLGITPQGWMRSWDSEGRVTHSAWPFAPALQSLPPNAMLVLSVEDLDFDGQLVQQYIDLASIVVVTEGENPAGVFVPAHSLADYLPAQARTYSPASLSGKARIDVPACTATFVDPTGAGDVFATGMFVRYHETGNPVEAARFAHAAAAANIEAIGTAGIPDRQQVLTRLARCTEGGD